MWGNTHNISVSRGSVSCPSVYTAWAWLLAGPVGLLWPQFQGKKPALTRPQPPKASSQKKAECTVTATP